ncbi:MAG: amidohydrolase family protein [Cyclobacteriaceae bacterium]
MSKFITLLFILNVATTAVEGQSGCFKIANAKVFSSGAFQAKTDVLVEDGVIKAIGKNLKSTCMVIDGEGKTLLPGLVNAHVHAWLPYHLQNAMEFGVFTLQDMHSLNNVTNELKALKKEDGYADLYGAGYAATVADGHGTQFGYPVPVIGANRSCYDFVDTQVEAGMDHIKIIYEPAAPTLSIEQVDSLISRSHYHGKKAVVHISRADDAMKMIALEADGLVHLWRDRKLSEAELTEMSESGIFIVPTLSVLEKAINYLTEKDRSAEAFTRIEMLDEIKRLHRAGILLLTGTDPPNYGLDYGQSLHHELQLFAEAGLSSADILTSATVNPFLVYGLESPGIAVGEDATFLMVQGDTENDINTTTNLLARWVKGITLKEK